MKISLAIALVSALSVSLAFAASDFESAYLTQVKLAKEYKQQAKGLKIGGQISVNRTEKIASFSVRGAPICKPGKPCPKFIKSVINAYEIPITSETKDSCGARTIVASRDARPVDGDLQTITVVDNRLNTCAGSISPLDTFITYSVTTAGFGAPAKTFKTTAKSGPLESEDSAP